MEVTNIVSRNLAFLWFRIGDFLSKDVFGNTSPSLAHIEAILIGQCHKSLLLLVSGLSSCVVEVDRVAGPYDIVAKLSNSNIDTIKESIGKHMTRIQGIQSTLTLMSED
jgi:DNA-binding Lrp family transcriptional regulator